MPTTDNVALKTVVHWFCSELCAATLGMAVPERPHD